MVTTIEIINIQSPPRVFSRPLPPVLVVNIYSCHTEYIAFIMLRLIIYI